MPLPGSGPRFGFSTLCNRTWRNDLVERLIARDHAEIAPGALFERLHAILQIAYFGRQLPIALAQLVILCPLRRNRSLQATQLADTILGQPYPVLQKHHYDDQGCAKPLHGRDSITGIIGLIVGSEVYR